jgi:hypothetical protein
MVCEHKENKSQRLSFFVTRHSVSGILSMTTTVEKPTTTTEHNSSLRRLYPGSRVEVSTDFMSSFVSVLRDALTWIHAGYIPMVTSCAWRYRIILFCARIFTAAYKGRVHRYKATYSAPRRYGLRDLAIWAPSVSILLLLRTPRLSLTHMRLQTTMPAVELPHT